MVAPVGEEFVIGQIPSRTDENPCESIPEEDLPTWAELIDRITVNDIKTMTIVFIGCEIDSDPERWESENKLGGWTGVTTRDDIRRVPLGGTPGHPIVSITQAIQNTFDWHNTFPYAQALTTNGLREEMGSLIVGIVIRKTS